VFYLDTLGVGKIDSIGEGVGGLVPPAGFRGRAPGQGLREAKSPEAGSFLLHK